jgi:hypothetical protein
MQQMTEWNVWTQRSVELLEKGYLDKLLQVYEGESGPSRPVPEEVEEKLREAYKAYEGGQNSPGAETKLVEAVLNARKKVGRSPFNHPYLPLVYYLVSEKRKKEKKTFEEALQEVASKHPETIRILAKEAQRRGVEALIQRLNEPPEINRQIGPMFKRWYKEKLKGEIEGRLPGPTKPKIVVVSPEPEQAPLIAEGEAGIIIYTGSDEALKDAAKENLGLGEKEKLGTKGVDFYVVIRRCPEETWHLTGEVKFQSDFGGNQDNQKLVAEASIMLDLEKRHIGIVVVDGMPVVSKFHGWAGLGKKTIVISVLLLPDLIVELYQKGKEALGL